MSHSSIFLISEHIPAPCTFHILPLCESYSAVLPQGHICASYSSSRSLVYLFFLPGRSRSPTPKSQFQRLRVLYWAVQIRFHSYRVLTPRISLKCSSCSFFLSAVFSLLFILHFATVLYLPKFSMDSITSWLPLISFQKYSTTLSHLIPARPFVTFSRTALSATAGNLYFSVFLTSYRHFNFLTSLFVLSGYIPSSAPKNVLLVVLEHPT